MMACMGLFIATRPNPSNPIFFFEELTEPKLVVFIDAAPIARDRIHSIIYTSFGSPIYQFQPLEY